MGLDLDPEKIVTKDKKTEKNRNKENRKSEKIGISFI